MKNQKFTGSFKSKVVPTDIEDSPLRDEGITTDRPLLGLDSHRDGYESTDKKSENGPDEIRS